MRLVEDAAIFYPDADQSVVTKLLRAGLREVELPSGFRVNFAYVSVGSLLAMGELPPDIREMAAINRQAQASGSRDPDAPPSEEATAAAIHLIEIQAAMGVREIWDPVVEGWRKVATMTLDEFHDLPDDDQNALRGEVTAELQRTTARDLENKAARERAEEERRQAAAAAYEQRAATVAARRGKAAAKP